MQAFAGLPFCDTLEDWGGLQLAMNALSSCQGACEAAQCCIREAGEIWKHSIFRWRPYLHCLPQDFLHKGLLPFLLASVKYR